MLRNILLGVGIFAAVFSVLLFSGRLSVGGSGDAKPRGVVSVWGTIPQVVMNPIIQSYNSQAQTYNLTYKEVNEEDFSQTVVEALANGNGPDVIIAPTPLILAQAARLYPFPTASFPEKKYRDTYIDAAGVFWTKDGALALPITADPMVLFYNRRLFSLKGVVTPPGYWDDVSRVSTLLTSQNDRGQFVQSGIDLGGVTTPYAKDILMAIVSQLGQTPVLPTETPGGIVYSVSAENTAREGSEIRPLSTALRYFAQFSDPLKTTYTWNDFSGAADEAFVAEKLAMYIGYSSELASLKERNPKASFDFSYFPQTKDYNTFVTPVKMYAIATLKSSKNPVAALTVESVFSGSGVAPTFAYALGAVPALRSTATDQKVNEVIARSILVGTAWLDFFPMQSSQMVVSMISDVINNRRGPSDAATQFVSRLQALYSPK